LIEIRSGFKDRRSALFRCGGEAPVERDRGEMRAARKLAVKPSRRFAR